MPLKLSAGISRKMGLPNYGSLGASCHLEVELDAGLFKRDPESFEQHVRSVYLACAQAVNEELTRQSHSGGRAGRASNGAPNGTPPEAHDGRANHRPAAGNGRRAGGGAASGASSGAADAAEAACQEPASPRQIDFLRALARQIRGLELRRLEALCLAAAGKPMAGLTALDASRLIDQLKLVRSGTLELASVLEGDDA